MAGKKKTTFAKLNREAKVREKRQAKSIRKQDRQLEGDTGTGIEHEVEDLSHLDVAFVEGVEPDVKSSDRPWTAVGDGGPTAPAYAIALEIPRHSA